MKKLNILKRIGTVFLSSVVLFSSINVTAFSTGNHTEDVIINIEDMEPSDEYEEIFYENEVSDDAETKNPIQEVDSIDDFQEEIIQLNQDTNLDSDSVYASKRLIVITDDSDFDTYESENAIAYGNLHVLSYSSESATRNAYNALKKNVNIASVETDSIVETSTIIEIEPAGAENPVTETVITSEDIIFPANASDIRIAVIDSGIDKNNSLFDGRIIDLGLNFSTSGDGIQDDNGHGTAVASVIANNSGAKIMPIKIANSDGKGTVLSLYLAIQAAIENDADIINISMTTSSSDLLTSVIEEANKEGIKVIASAGNESANVENYAPANIDGVYAVSSLDGNYLLSEFSNYGDAISYAAIGEDFEVPDLHGNMIKMSGTSLSSAYVSAALAYVMENKDDFNDYVYDLGEEGKDSVYGFGAVSLEDVAEKGNSDIEIPESENNATEEDESEVNIAAFTTVNTDFDTNGGAFTSNDAYQSETRGVSPYTYTVYRYQAGSRKDALNGSGTRVFSSSGTYDTGSVGAVYSGTALPSYKSVTDANLDQIPEVTALSGYFPANTTITFKIKTDSCGHTKDLYCGLKVGTVPSGANTNFDKYSVSRYATRMQPKDTTTYYTGLTSYKIGSDDFVNSIVSYTYKWNSTNNRYEDNDGDPISFLSGYSVSYPSTASTDANTNEVWIYSRGGGEGGSSNTASTAMTITYKCTKTGNYTFKTMGYAEHCTVGGNHVEFNIDTNLVYTDMENYLDTYTIKFNMNGGTGDIPSISQVGEDSSVVMGDISSTIPVREGYIFRGWSASSSWNSKRIAYNSNKSSDGTTATITQGTWTYADYCSYTGGNSSNTTLTLYALWETKCLIIYNANGGTGSMADQEFTAGSGATIKANAFTRNGYVFCGWNTQQNGTGISYTVGQNYNGKTNLTLYAQWDLLYTLTVKPNGGAWNGTTQNSTFSMATGTTKDIPVPVRSGYVFTSWNITTEAEYSVGSTITINNKTFVCADNNYNNTGNALFIMNTKYKLSSYSFNGQEGSYTNSNIYSDLKSFGETLHHYNDKIVKIDGSYSFILSKEEAEQYASVDGINIADSWTRTFGTEKIELKEKPEEPSFEVLYPICGYCGRMDLTLQNDANSSYPRYKCKNCSQYTYIMQDATTDTFICNHDGSVLESTQYKNIYICDYEYRYYLLYQCSECGSLKTKITDKTSSSFTIECSACKKESVITNTSTDTSANKYQCQNCGSTINSSTKPSSCSYCGASSSYLVQTGSGTSEIAKYAYCGNCYGTYFCCSHCSTTWYGTRDDVCPNCGKNEYSYCYKCGSSTKVDIKTIEREYSALYCKTHSTEYIRKSTSSSPTQPGYICSECSNGRNIIVITPENNLIYTGWSLNSSESAVQTDFNSSKSVFPAIVITSESGNMTSLTSKSTFTMGKANVTLTANWDVVPTTYYTVKHWKQNIGGNAATHDANNYTESTADRQTIENVTIGSNQSPAVKTYTGFTNPAVQTVTIADNGATVVNYYYTRNNYTVTYIDRITGTTTQLGTASTASKPYGSTVRGADKGNNTAVGAYYTGYYYASDTNATVTTSGATVYRYFSPQNYTVTYIDVVDSISGKELGRSTMAKPYNSTVRGSDKGSSGVDNAYYNGYYYFSDTSATVTTSGATVYRIFKQRMNTIAGNIIWIDWNNKNLSRPSSVNLYISGSDGSEYSYVITGNNSQNTSVNKWPYSKELPKYDSNGNVIVYTVSQDKAISQEEGLAYKDPDVNGYDVTNEITNIPEDYIKIPVTITWNDDNNQYGFRPAAVTLQLLRNGTVVKTISTSGNYTFTELLKYDSNGDLYVYTIQASDEDRYNKAVNNTAPYSKSVTYTFIKPTYSVIIPKIVILDGNTGIGEYVVSVKGQIDDRDFVNVIPDKSFTMNNDYLSPITATVKQNRTVFTNKENIKTGAISNGTITTKSLAGRWSGSFNFNIYFEFGR